MNGNFYTDKKRADYQSFMKNWSQAKFCGVFENEVSRVIRISSVAIFLSDRGKILTCADSHKFDNYPLQGSESTNYRRGFRFISTASSTNAELSPSHQKPAIRLYKLK
jgi:hypothetical protein